MPSPSSNNAIYQRLTRGATTLAANSKPGLGWLRKLQSALPGVSPLVRGFGWLLSIGTEGYPEDVRNRLKIVNCVAYLIGLTTAIYAIQYSIATGCTVFDFMQGDEEYKYRFGAQDYKVMRVVIRRSKLATDLRPL